MRNSLIYILCLWLIAFPAAATITVNQTTQGHCSGGGSPTCTNTLATMGGAVSANDLVVAGIVTTGSSDPGVSITDNGTGGTNTYSASIGTRQFLAGAGGCQFFATRVVHTGTLTVTATHSGVIGSQLHVLVLRGVDTGVSPVWDQHVEANGTSTAPSSGNLTTTPANEMLVGIFGSSNSNTFTAGSGYTLQLTDTVGTTGSALGTWSETQYVTAAGSHHADGTFGTSAAWVACMATFTDATQPGGGTNRRRVIIIGDMFRNLFGVLFPQIHFSSQG